MCSRVRHTTQVVCSGGSLRSGGNRHCILLALYYVSARCRFNWRYAYAGQARCSYGASVVLERKRGASAKRQAVHETSSKAATASDWPRLSRPLFVRRPGVVVRRAERDCSTSFRKSASAAAARREAGPGTVVKVARQHRPCSLHGAQLAGQHKREWSDFIPRLRAGLPPRYPCHTACGASAECRSCAHCRAG